MTHRNSARRTAGRRTAAQGAEEAGRGLRRAAGRCAEGAGPGRGRRARSPPTPRRAGWRCTSPAWRRKAADRQRAAEADAGGRGAWMPLASRRQALLKKLAAIGAADVPVAQLKRQGDGKAEALFLRQPRQRRDAGRRPAEGAGRGAGQAADPQGHELPAGRRLVAACTSCARRMGWWRCMATRWCRCTALGLQAQRSTHGHRFEAAASPIVLRDADSYAQQLRTKAR